MKGKTGIISDLRMLDHRAKPRHPESPARVKAILKMLDQQRLLAHPRVHYISKYDRAASDDDIRLVHTDKYVKYLRTLWPEDETRFSIPLSDSYCNPFTEMAARISAGGVLEGIDRVMSGEWANGFCVVRPPGHHAGEKGKINGFCVLNNVAMGARYLEARHDLSRIAILDYDVHEGDGTHHVFNHHKNVLFLSVHRYDRGSYYPGGPGGDFPNCGVGQAEGTKLNIPLNMVSRKRRSYDFQAPGDNEYIYLYNRIIHPVLQEFDPEFILVSSGFDASRKDYLGGFTVTPNAYFYITKRLLELGKPVLCVLEGGYHLGSTAQAATAVVRGLLREEELPEPIQGLAYNNIHLKCHLEKEYHEDFDEIIDHHGRYWKSLLSEENEAYTKYIKKNEQKVFGVFREESSSSSSEESEEEKEEGDTNADSSSPESFKKHELLETNPSKAVFKNFSYTNTRVLKLITPGELKFYEAKLPEKRYAPKYFGQEGDYLILENVLYKRKGGSIVEITLSKLSKSPILEPGAVERELKKESQSTSENLCFRVEGFTTPEHKEACLLVDDEGTIRKILRHVVFEKNKAKFVSFLGKMAGELKDAKRLYYGTTILLIRGKEESSIYWTNINYWHAHDTYDKDTVAGLQNLAEIIQSLD